MNKHIHRIIFSKSRGQFVAVSETALSQGKANQGTHNGGGVGGVGGAAGHISRLAAVALACSALFGGAMNVALAGPVGGVVAGGSASITQGANLTTIQQNSNRAIINWQSFGINAGQTVQVMQPGVNAALLNRVTGNLPTRIDGSLLANGQVFLVNPNGIVVGANGVVNVNGGFVASTQNVGDSAFMGSSALHFAGGQDGSVQVLGTIASANGPITLLAPKVNVAATGVLNSGTAINLIAASTVSLSNGKFTVTPQVGDAGQITMAGALKAAEVQLAAVNNNLGALAINTTGTVRATGVQSNPDGSIRIVATGQGRVEMTDAKLSAVNADGTGGKIDVTGNQTGLFGATVLDASGETKGGSVRVGGGFQGKEADIANGQATFVGTDVQLKADATTQGDGGRVVVWADGSTRYNGALSAKGAGTGKGGNAEVSGKGTLAFNGTADLRGGNAQAGNGTLLLDPSDITISNAADDSATIDANSPGVYNPTAGPSNLNIDTLKTALQTADVTVKTSGGTGGNGDITIVNAIDFANSSRDSVLRLEADRNIAVNGVLTDTGTSVTHVDMRAARDVNINAAIAVKGFVLGTAGHDINVSQPVQSIAGTSVQLHAAANNPLTANYYGEGWKTGTGVIRFTGLGSVGTTGTLILISGKDETGNRTNFTTSTNSTLTPSVLETAGFGTVNLDESRVGASLFVDAGTINISAANMGDNDIYLRAAGYDANNNFIDSNGWQDRVGRINFRNNNVTFAGGGSLDLLSGVLGSGPAIDNRSDLPGSVHLVNASGVRQGLNVKGFRDVTLSQGIEANSGDIHIVARNISIEQSLSTTSSARIALEAAAYDTGSTVPNSYAFQSAWQSQPGLLRFSNPASTTLTSNGFDLTSGVDFAGNLFTANTAGPGASTSAGIQARADLPSNLTFSVPAGSATPPQFVRIEGFRDVTLPFSAVLSYYSVTARNITVPASFSGISADYYLALKAGAFSDQAASPYFPGQPALVSTNDYSQGNLNFGIFNRPGGAQLDFNGRSMFVSSGSNPDFSRTSLNLGSVTNGSYVQGDVFNISGFDVITTKAGSPIIRNDIYNSSVSLTGQSIIVQSDISADRISLVATRYLNTDSGVPINSSGPGITFKNNPVLRSGSGPENQSLGGIDIYSYNPSLALKSSGVGGVTFGYFGPSTTQYSNFNVSGFDGSEILMESLAGVAQTLNVGLVYPWSDRFSVAQNSNAVGDVVLLSDVKITHGSFSYFNEPYIDGGGGGIRTGAHTISSSLPVSISASKDSAVNLAGTQVSVRSNGAGSTVVVNAQGNISVLDRYSGSDGNIEINARGEINLPTNWSRSNGASLTFRADAKYGRTLAPGASAFATTDLNTVFTNTGVFGEIGGDGFGAVTLASAGPILVTPVFRLVVVVEADTAAPEGLFDLSGQAIVFGTPLTRGQQFSTTGVLPNTNFDFVTPSGTPLRSPWSAPLGGFIVQGDALTYYDTNNAPIAPGTFLPTGTSVLIKNVYGSLGGSPTFVIGGYQTSATGSVPLYASLGTSFTTTHSTIGGSGTAGALAGDTPVNAAVAANYFGNPVTGTNTTLNLSGQFYTLDAAGGAQVPPTKLNQLATGGTQRSVNGNGWDIGFGTGTLSTGSGDLRIYSGPAHATNGPGYVQGGAADLNIYSNPPASTFGYTDTVRDGAVGVSTGTGNLVVLGYRDVHVEANGTLSSGGNVTIGAARDLTINAPVPIDNPAKLTTLIAGNMITATQTLGSAGTGNLMLVAGGGVNVATNVAVLSGSLQDSTARTGVLAGGVTPTGTFNVTNTGALTLGGPQTNTEVTDVSFDGTAGIVYEPSTPLARSGVVSTSVNGTTGFGAINIAATGAGGSITVAQDVRASQPGASVSLTATTGIAQTNTAARVAADSINLQALNGSIGSALAPVLVSKATPASATVPQVNFTQTGAAGTGVTIQGDAETNFSGSTTASDAGIALSTVNGTLRIRDNSDALGAGFNGINANGAGVITLSAGGAAGDVDSAAQTRSGTGPITVSAGRNILDSMAGELGSGTDTTASAALNFVTGGALVFSAADSVGGNGTSTPNALEVAYGTTLTSISGGSGAASGTYLTILDSTGGLGLPQPSLSVTSAKNVDITSRSSSTANTGDMTVGGAGITSANGGYIRVAADRNVTLAGTINANTSGNVVVASGLNASTGGSITQSAAGTITSGTGEVNLRAANDIVQGANITTAGNVLAQAVAGASTSTGGIWTSTGAAGVASLQAGTTMGTIDNRITTNAANTVRQSAGRQFNTSIGSTTLAAATTANGAIYMIGGGNLTVGDVGVTSALTSTTGGVTAAASGAPTALQGVAANGTGVVVLTVNGNLTLDRNVTSGSGTIRLGAVQDVRFALNNAQAATSSTVTVDVGNDIINATGQTSGVGSVDQIVASAAVLFAGRHIGSGVIDNTLTGANNAGDLNLNVASLTANAGVIAATGDAALWNRGAVTLVGANSAKGYFGINAGGLIQQAAGGTLTAASAEFDTMRNTSIGKVDLQNAGDLTIGSPSYAGGDYTASSQTGAVRLPSGTLNVNGNVTLNGAPVTITGTINASGIITPTAAGPGGGPSSSTSSYSAPLITITGNSAVINAQGTTAAFLLTSTLVSQLTAAGVTTLVINLANTFDTTTTVTTTSYSVASLNNQAIKLDNSDNAVAGNWTVRTGTAAMAAPTTTTGTTVTSNVRGYNLGDIGGPLDLGAANVTINAARGTAFAAGSQSSGLLAVDNAANTAAGFDAAAGSTVVLTQTQTSGTFSVKDAFDVTINSPGTVNAGYVYANRDLTLVAGSTTGKNLNLSGALTAGRHLIGVAGMDVNLNAGTSISAANGRVTLVADETAGTAAGTGRFTNNVAGLNIAAGTGNDVAIYAVAGGSTPAAYEPVDSRVLFNGLRVNGLALSETQPEPHWNNAYQRNAGGSTNWAGYAADGAQYVAGAGKFGSPQVWYKTLMVEVIPVDIVKPNPVTASTVIPTPYTGECLTQGVPFGRYLPHQYGNVNHFARTSYLPVSAAGDWETQEDLRNGDCNPRVAYLPTVYRPEAARTPVATTPATPTSRPVMMPAPQATVSSSTSPVRLPHRVTISADSLFAFDKSELKDLLPEGLAKVQRLVSEINKSLVNVSQVLVIGHTDRLGGDAYNLELSRKRAETVRALLVSNGMDSGLIRTAGRGKTEPVVECRIDVAVRSEHVQALRDCLQPNRRVNVDILGDAAD